MKDKAELVKQCSLAFEFIQKLYFEASYLIKEIEGILDQKGFKIGRPKGYQINTRSSSGLDTWYVNLWLLRKFGVFFAREEQMSLSRGRTTLSFESGAKIIYLRVLLDDDETKEPLIYYGVLYGVKKGQAWKWPAKFENVMQHIEYNDDKIFNKDLSQIDHQDAYIEFKGHLLSMPLFDINDSKIIVNKIIEPSIALFNKY